MAELLTVGSVAFDTIRTPRGHAERVLGGAATYFALAARFFAPVRVVAVVGEDFLPVHEETLSSRGICLRGVERAAGKSFFWEGEYERNPNNRRTLATELNVFEKFTPRLPDDYLDSPYVFLANIDPMLQVRVADEMKSARIIGGDTMNYWIEQTPDELRAFLRRLQLLIINDSEAVQLSGEHNLLMAARAILALGPKALIVKRGEHGASLYTADGFFGVPAYPLEDVFDPTGAGDAFGGGVMGYLAATDAGANPRELGAALRRAVVYGSVMGSFACERFGVERLCSLTREEIERRYREFVELTHFHVPAAAAK
jgi:sugar/nucleoside kinase (ribokinase family)